MKQIVILILLFSFQSTLIIGQTNILRKVEKGKYDKAEKKINKALKKDPNDIVLNYSFAILLMKRNYKGYNISKSYEYLLQTESLFLKTREEKELNRLAEIPINSKVISSYLDTICRYALDDANKIYTVEAFENYLTNYTRTPSMYKNTAVTNRNALAYAKAKETNDIQSYKAFIKKYPEAVEVKEAWENVYDLAYKETLNANTIAAFENYISQYPKAKQVTKAYEKIHELAFAEAKNENSSLAMGKFLEKYPKSKEYNEAFTIYEELQFSENIIPGDWNSYKNFIIKYNKNSLVKRAQDCLINIAYKSEDFKVLDYCLSFSKDQSIIDLHYDAYTKDGELSSIYRYKIRYPFHKVERMANDLYYAEMADKFLLHLPYNSTNQPQYIEYLKNVGDRDMAYVIIQRMISPYLDKLDYKGALKCIEGLPVDKNSYFFKNLETLLSNTTDKTIKPIALRGLNTKGNEFSPILTADEKKIFFCGQNRDDNIGGEDIFEAEGLKGNFIQPKLELNLSTKENNEAPVSISSDGTVMLLFQSGKINYSIKTNTGWSPITSFDNKINNGIWQGDAMITSDGNNLLFSAVRSNETLNTNQFNDNYYHGDILYPTDIFVSSKDSLGNWLSPVNIGSTINSRYCERFPFLHPDMKTLYFSSDGHGGLGKMDVFKSTRLNDSCWNCWSEPVNMGKEINTSENDAGYKISTSGDKAYFSLNKRKASETSVLFLLDVSGSMAGDKIAELKRVSKITCEEVINNNAEVAIATFNGTCTDPLSYYLPFTKDYSQVENFIDNINSSGGTPLYEAYYRASFILSDESNTKIKNKIMVLMTDGDATSCGKLQDVINKLKNAKKLFKTQTIAYEVAQNSVAYLDLNLISNMSKGNFYHAVTTEDLGAAFEKASGNIFEIVAGPDNKDLYSLILPKHLRPDFVAKVSGKLTDSQNKPVATKISWEDLESKKIIGTANTDPKDGSYFIALPMGKNYGYYIEDSTYFPISQNLDLRDSLKAIEIKNQVKVITFDEMIENGISVPMNNLFFAFGKYDLLPSSIPELKRMVNIIKKYNLKVEISGHTDNVGDDKSNQLLSDRRSKSVKDFLIVSGCDDKLLQTIGYGESKPVDSNDNERGRANNRRVELRFVK
jgi:outer membrane protein OmpA-like peptidoglycan-associated protein/Mg-chelatase subunit ChlD